MSSRYIPLGPFTFTATGDLGEQRDPMLCNGLILRDRPGQPKSRGFYLPGKGFTYGRPNEKRDYTAADALRGWTGCYKDAGLHKAATKQAGRDFAALNRAAVSAGLVTAKEHYDYRTTHDYRLKPPPDYKSRAIKFPANMVFGLPPRPSTPMFDILEHRYQDKWIKQRFNQVEAERSKQSKKKSQLAMYDTRASLLRTFQNPVDPVPLWQMPRFKNNVGAPSLSLDCHSLLNGLPGPTSRTFRSSKAKEGAWTAADLDQVSRKGTIGQGVYEAAKN